MGIERDFIMRQLMMLFNFLQKIMALRKKGDNEEAEESIQEFYAALKIEGDLTQFSIEELIVFLEEKKKLSIDHLEIVAMVLKEQGELCQNVAMKLNYFSKAYFILQKVELNSTSFSVDRQLKLAELKELI